MRSLKKLLAVIVAICVLATFTIPAFAADSATYANADQATKLNSMGLYAGISTTSFDPDLGSTLTREQGMVILLKMFGQLDAANAMTDADTDAALAAFTDAKDLSSWAKKAFAYVVKNSISSGTSDTTLGPKGTFTGNQFATLILKEAGFTVADWTKAAEELTTKGVAGAGALATTVLTRDQLVGMAFGALTVNNAAGKTIVAALVDAGKVTAAAAEAAGVYSAAVKASSIAGAGAKKLLVKFSAPVPDTAKMVLSVKRDGFVVNLVAASTTWNADKTEATLATSYLLQDGKYVVTAKYDTQDATTATADIKAAAVSKISFVSANAVIGTPNTTFTTTLKFENQYGEDVTNDVDESKVSISTSNGYGTTGATPPDLDKGTLKITAAGAYTVGNTVVVTVVYNGTSVVGSATLTLAQTADIASISLGEVTTTNSDHKGKPIYLGDLSGVVEGYYIPVTAKDQYGNTLKEADLASLIIVSSSTTVVASGAIDSDADGNPIITLADPAALVRASGTAVITAVSTSGKSASATVVISDKAKTDKLEFSSPADPLKQTKESILPFTAVNQYGEALVSKDDLVYDAVTSTTTKAILKDNGAGADGTVITITNGTIAYGIDYANKNAAQFKVTPDAAAKSVVITVITANAKVQTLTLAVQDKPVPVAISGLTSDFKTAIEIGQSQTLKQTYVNLVDQYGDDIDLPAGWAMDVAADDGTWSNVGNTVASLTTLAPQTVIDADAKGTETVKLTLKDDSATPKVIDEFKFGVEAVDPGDITGYTIDDFTNSLYTGAVDAAHDMTYTVYGLKGTTKVVVDPAEAVAATFDNANVDASTVGTLTVTAKATTDGADKTGKLTVLVQGKNDLYTIVKNVTYNDAAPVAKVLTFKKADDSVIADPVVTLAFEDGAAPADYVSTILPALMERAGLYVYVEDQYGVAIDDATFVVTNQLDAAGDPGAVVTVSNDALAGTVGLVGRGADYASGACFKLTAITKNGMSKTITVYIE